MRNSRLMMAGGVLLVTGLLLTTGLLGWVIAAIGTLAIVAAVLLLAILVLKALGVAPRLLAAGWRKPQLVAGSAALFLLGMLLTSGLMDTLLRTIGAASMVAGVVALALWVLGALRARLSHAGARASR